MKKSTWSLNQMLHSFFEEYLTAQFKKSPHTVTSYGYAWRLFLQFLQKRRGKSPSELLVADLTADDLLAFLDYIEHERKNCVKTRNIRLAAIRCAVNYALAIDPMLPPAIHRITAIPRKKTKRREVGFLEQPELDSLLVAPDITHWSGRRDRILFETMYNTGSRVSEAIAVKVSDVRIVSAGGQITLHGKGRKERTLPLWKNTAKHLQEWIRTNGLTSESPLFPTARGGHMTRSAVEKRLQRVVAVACRSCPSLSRQKISPHTIRHTTAMHLFDSGVEITALSMWLGHESIETTNIYLSSSMERKEKTLAKLKPPEVKSFRFKAEDSLIAYLERL